MSRREHVTSEDVQRELAETAATLPIYARLPALFTDRRMFDSYDRFRSEGFRLAEHSEHKILCGSHKSMGGFLFKKYNNDRPGRDQLLNYMFRIEGSRVIRALIMERGFTSVIAPQKWLYELPPSFPERYLVVAERLDLVSESETLRNYDRIGRDQMRELATMLYYFRGLNSTASNLPFTEDGKIAFIDTERWHHDKDYLRKVGNRLSSDRRKLAEDVYDELRRGGARPIQSAYRRKSRRHRDDDFEREEDTSSVFPSSS
jgi:hypothetical protein